ncbi:hypothetical protein ABIA44_002066 [Bradyrhizobium sp. USDA 329]
MPTKMPKKLRRPHQLQQLRIVGEVDRGFRGEFEGIAVRALPFGEPWQELPQRLLVADEIVVDEVEMAAVAHPIERLELDEHLLDRLGPRHAPVELDDVAEFAGEGTAPRILHTEIEIVFEPEQVETRHRRLGDVGLEFRRGEDAGPRAAFPGRDEFVDDALGLAEHPEVGPLIEVGARGGIGTADDHRLASGAAELDQAQRVGLLRHHPAGEHDVGPGEIVVAERRRVAIDQPDRPALGQHRGDGDQAQGGGRALDAHHFAGFAKAPEGLCREQRVEHQHVAGTRHVHGTPFASAQCTRAEASCIPAKGTNCRRCAGRDPGLEPALTAGRRLRPRIGAHGGDVNPNRLTKG